MAKKVKNKKLEFGALIKELESNEYHYGNLLIEEEDILSSICYYLDEEEKEIDSEKFYELLKLKRESILYTVERNIGWYISEILEGIGEDIWSDFGDEILKLCSPTSESNDSI